MSIGYHLTIPWLLEASRIFDLFILPTVLATSMQAETYQICLRTLYPTYKQLVISRVQALAVHSIMGTSPIILCDSRSLEFSSSWIALVPSVVFRAQKANRC